MSLRRQIECGGAGRIQGQRTPDGVKGHLAIAAQEDDDEACDRQRGSVVGAAYDDRSRVAETFCPMRLVKASSGEAPFVGPGDQRVRGHIARVEIERFVQKLDSSYSVLWHLRRGVRQGAQVQVICIQIVRTLLPRTL